ncbi:putative 20S-pre-rRNA D-site endonuclease nob1 [Amylocarpus encephaloides]|uniref:20S-pre-rRNA D-site endonuclease NOB1 n=1 Tax=Amylocarpus encephaloides TaxID=45428 RepID=A0A9P8C791_9HELO|nr:putative 20S-pre-rRNA D-site endonuclease nob1 [Amylocarpus encephaloides]
MTTSAPKPIHSLVLDAGPIIKNEPPVSSLLGRAEKLYTVPAVIDEIRDPIARARFDTTLNPLLTCRSPSAASVKVITDFARRTGDLEVLSRPDIHLLALAYELECERNNGDWRLRSVPGQKRLNGAPPAVEEKAVEAGSTIVDDSEASDGTESKDDATRTSDVLAPNSTKEPATTELEAQFVTTHISTPDSVPERLEANNTENTARDSAVSISAVPDNSGADASPAEEDLDEEGWITPGNLKEHQAKDADGQAEPEEQNKVMQVATITSDFAMQNVLLRMNLNLLAPSLYRIRQLKTWVLRCHACFFVTRDMTKQFCTRCGKPTLLRVACSTDNNGQFTIHLKKNMQWNTRGNVYSIPKPVAGSSNGKLVAGGGQRGWGQGLILAEDQKEYVAAITSGKRRKEKDLMDEDYLPNILSGDRNRAGGRPKVGAGKGVNSRKRK